MRTEPQNHPLSEAVTRLLNAVSDLIETANLSNPESAQKSAQNILAEFQLVDRLNQPLSTGPPTTDRPSKPPKLPAEPAPPKAPKPKPKLPTPETSSAIPPDTDEPARVERSSEPVVVTKAVVKAFASKFIQDLSLERLTQLMASLGHTNITHAEQSGELDRLYTSLQEAYESVAPF